MKMTIAPLLLTLVVAVTLVNSSDAATKKLRGFQRDYDTKSDVSRSADLVSVAALSTESGPGEAMTNHLAETQRSLQVGSGTEGSVFDKLEELDEEEEYEEEDINEEGRNLVTTSMTMSSIEKANAGYVQSVRKAKGLPAVYFSADLVTEARRWSKYMAAQGRAQSRPSLSLNVAAGWKKIGEVTGQYNSVSTTSDGENEGAIVSMIHNNRTKDNLLNSDYNRIGVGITQAADGSYYVTVLTKAV